MNRPFLDDFENFIADRINTAEDRLDRNENFKAQRLSLRQNIEALSSTLNPQQTDTFTAIDEQRAVILSLYERNAYCLGLSDGLQLISRL